MTPNRSLALSLQLKELMRADILHKIADDFPSQLIEEQAIVKDAPAKRDRVYNEENTLLTMIVSAINEDKSLKQAVNLFKGVFEFKGKKIREKEAMQLELEKKEEELNILAGISQKAGRPRLFLSQLPKSKVSKVSDNTAAYSKARERIDKNLVNKIFDYSSDFKSLNAEHWYGMTVFSSDGTYLQLQDTKELREKYYVKKNDVAYPQGLLQAILRQGSGQVHAFSLGTRHQSELELIKPLLDKLPEKSLLLADDLYSTYAIFGLMQSKGLHLIVPGKRERKYTIKKTLADGDQIVEIARTQKPDWLNHEQWQAFPNALLMRRISYKAPNEDKDYVLFSTLTDEKITKTDIVLKYATRWDIEITIREIKTVMGINIVRSKTEAMVDKEITIALTSYNMVRKIIAESVQETDFSPKADFFPEFIAIDKKLFVDKKGRVYHHWSTGRYGQVNVSN